MMIISYKKLLMISALLRIILIIYGEWHDAHMEVRYTDIDYIVFSDAASLVAAGRSPYLRSTYRYSPLLAYLLVPNSLLHRTWGKIIFSASDLLVGILLHTILEKRGVPERLNLYCVAFWLFNPFTFTIGTRGNCEPLVCAAILWIILSFMNGNLFQAAFCYGLVVHFRIYPIIYALTILMVLDPCKFQLSRTPTVRRWSEVPRVAEHVLAQSISYNPLILLKLFITKERLLFGSISLLVFSFWTLLFFFLYGWGFLQEAFLYHLIRTDPRHNFSIYFYYIYLHHMQKFSVVMKLVAFLPQLAVQLVLILCFAQDLPFCFFVQTVAFVVLNKVITAQYFVWYFCLLPLILPWTEAKMKWKGLFSVLFWVGVQAHWLWWGYQLEFGGKTVFLQLWLASILFLVANTVVLVVIIRNHRISPLFVDSRRQNADKKLE